MNGIDSTVREFSISFYPPATFKTVFLILSLAALFAAGTWLGVRLYLHLFGARTEGKVTEATMKTLSVKDNELSISRFVYTNYLKIEFTDPDGVQRTLKGKHYSNHDDRRSPENSRVGGTVPVLYSRAHPAFAIYYDPLWHYLVPVAALVIALLFSYAAGRLCYEDIRDMNALSLADATRNNFEKYNKVIIESSIQLNGEPDNAAIYEQRGDAQFATMLFGDAIEDYSAALRLQPDGRELLLKRAKAEWLDGRDFDALRDWRHPRRK